MSLYFKWILIFSILLFFSVYLHLDRVFRLSVCFIPKVFSKCQNWMITILNNYVLTKLLRTVSITGARHALRHDSTTSKQNHYQLLTFFLVFIDLSASLVIKALVVNLYSWLWLLLCKREQKIWTIWNVSNYSNVTKVM